MALFFREWRDMLYYIKGKIVETGPDHLILDHNGIGFRIFTTGRIIQELTVQGKEEVLLYTHHQIREDEWVLFGFPDRGELRVFRKLITVSGVGPKVALSILNLMTVEELYYAIQSGDSKAISKTPGIGPKIAQRVVVDLKGSIEPVDMDLKFEESGSSPEQSVVNEVAEALTSLGYSNMDALRAIRKVEGADQMTVEKLLSAALKKI